MKLIFWPNKVLEKPAKPVRDIDNINQIISPMRELMKNNDGIGLAAPQIGVSEQMIIWEIEEELKVLINPKIEFMSGSDIQPEGCLSIPGILVEVPRPERMIVSGLDQTGSRTKLDLGRLESRIVGHELDHISGILILDYLSGRDRKRAEVIVRDFLEKADKDIDK